MTEEERIIARILNVIPPSSFELTTFLSLFRVRYSDTIETACVTCSNSPELLLNKEFIETYCKTDEHLVILIMHELYHVILGHTTLFPHTTPVRNIVFDAVINAILCTLFPYPEYTSFFTNYYPADQMPYALLRPKGESTPKEAEFALKLLYDGSNTGTYYDVYESLLTSGCVQEINIFCINSGLPSNARPSEGASATNDASGNNDMQGKPVLLGSHDSEEDLSPEMKDLLHEIISKWPSPDRPLQGRDMGSNERERDYDAASDPTSAMRRGLRQIMRQAELPGSKEARCRAIRERLSETETFLPNWRDRSHEARESALGEALLYRSAVNINFLSPYDNKQAFVYFDVSGSVADEVPSVAQALLPYCKRGLCTVHVFSTVVHPASVSNLIAHKFVSTEGTDIDCVLSHVLDLKPRNRPRAVVIITDGFTGSPNSQLARRFRAARMRLYVGLVKSDSKYDSEKDLASIAEKFIKLY